MRVFLIALLALTTINCSNTRFSNDQLEEILDGIQLDGDNTGDDDIGDNDDIDDDQDDDGIDDDIDDEVICPRYDLVVKSTHQNTKKLNYIFTFNGEVTHSSTQGDIDVIFLKDGSSKFTQCSGSYKNSTVSTSLNPLKAVEKLTAELVINHGVSCPTVVPERTTLIQVIDSATNKILWDEKEVIDMIGSCEFGYSSVGQTLRNQILGLSDGVVNKMASACNK